MAVTVAPARYSLTTPLQVFVGRHRPDLAGAQVETITDWESTPLVLGERLSSAPGLVVWDPLAFPWEGLGGDASRLPLWIVLDSSRPETGSLVELLGEQMLRRLTFFDRIVTDSDATSEALIAHYGFGRAQVTVLEELDPGAVVGRALSELAHPDLNQLAGWHDVDSYWEARGQLLASSHPARAVLEPRLGLEDNKAIHLEQLRALRPLLAGADPAKEWAVTEVGCGIGRWAMGLPRHVRYSGFDVSEAMLSEARVNFPDREFGVLSGQDSIPLPGETCDVVFTSSVLHHNPPARRHRLIQSMLSILKVGGTLAFMEDFVAPPEPDELTLSYPFGVRGFMDEVLAATNGDVVLRHVESLQYRIEPSRRTALVALTKIGSPRSL